MDWTVYWFMLPVCIAVASAAMFSGISGAAMLMPVFLIGFPLLGAPALSTVAAVGMALFLETSGFGTGIYRYLSRGLADTRTAGLLIIVTVPAAMLGAIAARWVPADALRLLYGLAMMALSVTLLHEPKAGRGAHLTMADGEGHQHCSAPHRVLHTSDGATYRYCVHGIGGQRVLSGVGAVMAGLISTGVGEMTLPALVRRSRFPLPVAAATSAVVVGATVAGATVTHLTQLARDGGLAAVPWNLLVWAVPGAVIGAVVGTHLQGRVPDRAAQLFFAGLFGLIGMVFVAVFGLGMGGDLLA